MKQKLPPPQKNVLEGGKTPFIAPDFFSIKKSMPDQYWRPRRYLENIGRKLGKKGKGENAELSGLQANKPKIKANSTQFFAVWFSM